MITRSNNRNLILLIIVLLVTNGIMLYLLTTDNTREKESNGPQLSRSERQVKMVQDALGLDSVQVINYTMMRNYRDSLLKPIQADIRMNKLAMMDKLWLDSVNSDSLDLLSKRIGEKEAQMELEYFNHFKRMKEILRANQIPKLDSLIERMVVRSTGGTDSTQSNNGKSSNK